MTTGGADSAPPVVFSRSRRPRRWSLSHLEGGNATGLPFRGADPNDPVC